MLLAKMRESWMASRNELDDAVWP